MPVSARVHRVDGAAFDAALQALGATAGEQVEVVVRSGCLEAVDTLRIGH